jgi:hypothetical protein
MADALINNVFVSFTADENNEYKPIYSESGHLAYFLTRENYNEIRTLFDIDGSLYRYIYVLSDDMVKDPEAVREFVNGF